MVPWISVSASGRGVAITNVINEMLTINAKVSSIETVVINYNEQMRE